MVGPRPSGFEIDDDFSTFTVFSTPEREIAFSAENNRTSFWPADR